MSGSGNGGVRQTTRAATPWFGTLPEGWKIKTLRSFLRGKSLRGCPEKQLLSVTREKGVIVRGNDDEDDNHNYIPDDLNNYKVVAPGNFVINKMKSWQGSYGVSEFDGIVSPAYYVYELDGVDRRFFSIAIRSKPYIGFFAQRSKGIRVGQWDLDSQSIKEIPFAVPPRPVQRQIVAFLDEKTAALNRLAEIRNNQFTLLQELVARQFRDVSVASTKKARLKHFVQLLQDFISLDSDATYTKTGMYNRGRGIFRREPMLGKDMGDSMFQEIHAGCVMISGQFAWEAAAYITSPEDEAGVASHRYYLLKPSGRLTAEYIWCFLMSDYGQELMKQCSHGAAGRNRPLNIRELLNEYIPIPSDERGLADLARNVHVLMDFRKLIAKEEAELGALKSRIIANAVTGRTKAP